MNELTIYLLMLLGTFVVAMIAVPWVGYAIVGYWKWCTKIQQRARR